MHGEVARNRVAEIVEPEVFDPRPAHGLLKGGAYVHGAFAIFASILEYKI